MIAVIVPANDEQERITECVRSVVAAGRVAELNGEPVCLVVVADACTDATERLARQHGAEVIHVHAHNVGVARAAGAQWAIAKGARWLAFTDADTVVEEDWLAAQLRLNADVVCGTIGVSDWSPMDLRARLDFEARYQDRDDHRHVHGANLGVSAHAYLQAGGFLPLHSGEDVALVDALRAKGFAVAWTSRPRVNTSARRDFKAPGGFGALVKQVAEQAALSTAGS